MNLICTVRSGQSNIKQVLKENLSISERLFKKVKHNHIFVNGIPYLSYKPLKPNDMVTVDLDFSEECENIVPNENINFKILYEDEWLIIVDKPCNMPVHPSLNYYETSLSNGIKAYYIKKNIHKKIRPINRLDKDTTGIVMFAKSEYIQDNLKNYEKEYVAICTGRLEGSGIINKNIKRKTPSIIERCVCNSNEGEVAITEYNVLSNFKIDNNNYSLVKCTLKTGRTHQIRVHLSSIGHPILGDSLYGEKTMLISRQLLHAYRIKFKHPVTKEEIEIIDEIPEDMQKLID